MLPLSQESTLLEAGRLVTRDVRDYLLRFSDPKYRIKDVLDSRFNQGRN